MKKSYDYFKTFKILSEENRIIFEKMLLNNDYSSNCITFLAEKSELVNNLRIEFITPFERGDIFFLCECLTEELNSMLVLQDYMCLLDRNVLSDFGNLLPFLEKQTLIFSQLRSLKSNLKLFEECSEEVKRLNTDKKRTEKVIIDAIKCKSEQPLVKYAVYSAYLDLNRKINKTILQIERILIDNS